MEQKSQCSQCGGTLLTDGENVSLEQWWDDGYGGKRCINCHNAYVKFMNRESRDETFRPSVGCIAIVAIICTAIATQLAVWLK